MPIIGFTDVDQVSSLVEELVQTRKMRGLTQSDVARMMGVGQPTISQFEKNQSIPQYSTITRYAAAVRLMITYRIHIVPEETDDGQ